MMEPSLGSELLRALPSPTPRSCTNRKNESQWMYSRVRETVLDILANNSVTLF